MSRSGSTGRMLVPGGDAYRDFAIKLLSFLRDVEGDTAAMLTLEGDSLVREYAGWDELPPDDPARPEQWQLDIMAWSKRAGPMTRSKR